MRFVELFAGIGGFRKGLEQASDKYVCVWANEWDKYAGQIYNKNFKEAQSQRDTRPRSDMSNFNGQSGTQGGSECSNSIDTRDIRTVHTSEIPDHDLLVGGFPCQAFSIAGKRRGFDDTRGTLFFEIARILKDKQPKYFILENVKGLLSHDNGNTFKTIISTLTELGYDLQWQVVNSKNFGVPQNRERVFIVGHIRGEPRPQVFPIGQESGEDTRRVGKEVSYTIDANYWKGTNTITKGRRQIISPFNRRKEFRTSEVCNTITSHFRGNPDGDGRPAVLDNMRIRRLTPTECERLQGFPDGWTEGISDTQRYKCLGNAVTVNVVEYIARKLIENEL